MTSTTRIFRSSCRACFLGCEGEGVTCDVETIERTLQVAEALSPTAHGKRKRKGVKRGKAAKDADRRGTGAVR